MAQQQTSAMDVMLQQIADLLAPMILERIMPVLERNTTPADNGLIDRKQALEMLNIDTTTLYKWEKQHKLERHGKIGGKIYYSKDDVKKAMKQ